MTDLAVLVPSRGRPANVARLVEACKKTCRAGTHLMFGIDNDDPARDTYIHSMDWESSMLIRDRMGLVAWTNYLAANQPDVPYLASLGDDMVPITDGWDAELITAVEKMGGGYAYPDDKRRADIPEAVVVDARIVKALGWFALPSLSHWFCDDVWGALGKGAGRLAYCPDVIVEHRHPNVYPDAKPDATYDAAAATYLADAAEYRRWRLYQMPKDVLTVKTACSR